MEASKPSHHPGKISITSVITRISALTRSLNQIMPTTESIISELQNTTNQQQSTTTTAVPTEIHIPLPTATTSHDTDTTIPPTSTSSSISTSSKSFPGQHDSQSCETSTHIASVSLQSQPNFQNIDDITPDLFAPLMYTIYFPDEQNPSHWIPPKNNISLRS